MTDWRPTTALDALTARAQVLQQIRQFFSQRGVLEVSTPQLARHGVTDPHVPCIPVQGYGYLQSSPEYHMKRLLAAGAPAIYQISHVFRDGESGSRHNPEFTLLEWYQPGYQLQTLIDECVTLLTALLEPVGTRQVSFRDLFRQCTGIDPLTGSEQALAHMALEEGAEGLSRAQAVDLLMSTRVESSLPEDQLTVVTDFPGWAAALAETRTDQHGETVACRFECYYGGQELANGYQELTNASEQARRFDADRDQRRESGLPDMAADDALLAALEHGLPACAGVAVGIERVLMAQLGADHISKVWPFPSGQA